MRTTFTMRFLCGALAASLSVGCSSDSPAPASPFQPPPQQGAEEPDRTADEELPVTEPPPLQISYDLNVALLTRGPCLDLESALRELRAFSQDARMRKFSSDFTLDALPGDSLRTHFVSLASFANFAFEEKPLLVESNSLPNLRQTGCETVAIEIEIAENKSAPEIVTIEATSTSQVLNLLSTDGSKQSWTLKGPRELEVIRSSTLMDPCPSYSKARSVSKMTIQWGSQAELDQIPISISRYYLQQATTAILTVPTAIADLVTRETTDLVATSADDLRSLLAAPLDPGVQKCPYRSEPPDGEEPLPPPDVEPIPNPLPTPEPVPVPPQPTPEPFPAPLPPIVFPDRMGAIQTFSSCRWVV